MSCVPGHDVPRRAMYPMVSMDDAIRTVVELSERGDGEGLCGCRVPVSVETVLGRVLAEDVYARSPHPPFRASIKDGYAVVSGDGPGVYPVVREVTAGGQRERDKGNGSTGFSLLSGQVAYITTGAPVPDGADAVCPVEHTEMEEGGCVRFLPKGWPTPGADIREVGSDVELGALLVGRGQRIGPQELGLLCTCKGVSEEGVLVLPQPVVAVLSTGDELVEYSENDTALPRLGQIYDSNRPMLMAAITQAGARVLDCGICGDDPLELKSQLDRALNEADLVITSGGVSMGNKDLLKSEMEARGTIHFGRVRMKPGKPLTCCTVEVQGRRKMILGLPGNPISSFVCFHLVVAPAIRNLAGIAPAVLPRIRVKLMDSIRLDPERPEFHRAIVKANSESRELEAFSTGRQASSRLLSAKSANALLALPQSSDTLQRGEMVWAMLIGDLSYGDPIHDDLVCRHSNRLKQEEQSGDIKGNGSSLG